MTASALFAVTLRPLWMTERRALRCCAKRSRVAEEYVLASVSPGATRTGLPAISVGELRFVQWQTAVSAEHFFVSGSRSRGCQTHSSGRAIRPGPGPGIHSGGIVGDRFLYDDPAVRPYERQGPRGPSESAFTDSRVRVA